MPAFDFHTLSLTIDSTLAEYLDATGLSKGEVPLGLGLNIGDISIGDRTRFLRFRHEHAHFASFVACGLADLYGIFSDYISVMCYVILRAELRAGSGKLRVPVYTRGISEDEAAYAAYQQVNTLRACLFGFGSRISRRQLLDHQAQDTFWPAYYDRAFLPIITRYYRLLELLSSDAEPPTGDVAEEAALPRVEVGGRTLLLSARAVMEAYAITIEVVATHLRKLESSETYYGSAPTRNPGPLYTVALQYALEQGPWRDPVTLADFLAGDAPLECYYVIPVLTFAAMQVPVLQSRDGEVFLTGDRRNLSIAHAFHLIVTGIRAGAIPPPPPDLRNAEAKDRILLDWLRECRRYIGDDVSIDIAADVHRVFQSDEDLITMTAESQTVVQLAFAARANFLEAPAEYVLDAGLFVDRYLCQPRFVRTSDNKLVMLTADTERFQARYLSEHVVPILEATVFAQQWDSTWAKLPEIDADQRPSVVRGALGMLEFQFNDLELIGETPVVEVSADL
jgi:hypothetical protein